VHCFRTGHLVLQQSLTFGLMVLGGTSLRVLRDVPPNPKIKDGEITSSVSGRNLVFMLSWRTPQMQVASGINATFLVIVARFVRNRTNLQTTSAASGFSRNQLHHKSGFQADKLRHWLTIATTDSIATANMQGGQ